MTCSSSSLVLPYQRITSCLEEMWGALSIGGSYTLCNITKTCSTVALNIPFSQAEGKVGVVDDTVQNFGSVFIGFLFFPFLYWSVLDPEMSKTSTVCCTTESEKWLSIWN